MRKPLRTPALAVGAILLAGCGAAADPSSSPPESGTHTMPDGSVMSGDTHGQHREGGGAHESRTARPSEAAAMVCGGQVADDVSRLLSLDSPPEPSSTWDKPMFTCTFDLAEGPLVLSVHDAMDPEVGRAHFADLRSELDDTKPLRGMYGLGLPAYETEDGTVVFIRDGKTLRVDATALPKALGPDGLSPSELAYAVATSVLACWTEHA